MSEAAHDHRWRNRVIGLGVAIVVALIDQAVKALMIGPLHLREVGLIKLIPFFDLRWTENFGVSLGMLTATSLEQRWALVAMTFTIAVFVLVWLLRERKMGDIFALSLVLGGAIGNIHDRVSYGYVVDYADLHFGEWRPFYIFNLADAAITIGVLIILARSLLLREKPEADTGSTAPES